MAKQPTQSTELMEKADPQLMAELEGDMGKGLSTDAADNLVPLIYILQPLSPQVMDGPAQIDGAKAGDIWLKNFSADPIVSGKDGIWFMPCTMYQKWTEWVPRDKGGGWVGSFDYNAGKLPNGAMRDVKEKRRPRFTFPETGNELIDTRYEAGLVWHNGQAFPYVIPFKSTGHAISRGWMTKRNSLTMAGAKKTGTLPAWSHLYLLTTSRKQNALGQWYQFDIGVPVAYMPGLNKPHKDGLAVVGGDAGRAYAMGKALAAAFATGEKTEAPEDGAAHEPEQSTAEEMKDEIPY
jgi:hypothetical protein